MPVETKTGHEVRRAIKVNVKRKTNQKSFPHCQKTVFLGDTGSKVKNHFDFLP